ncbi:MAG: hypothetical protein ACRD10_12295, partial [Terriglobia bacterium]
QDALRGPVVMALDSPRQAAGRSAQAAHLGGHAMTGSAVRATDLASVEELANAAPGASWLAIDDPLAKPIRGVAAILADGDPRSGDRIRRFMNAIART